MKVYILSALYDRFGYDEVSEIIKVFTSKDKALDFLLNHIIVDVPDGYADFAKRCLIDDDFISDIHDWHAGKNKGADGWTINDYTVI